MNVDDWENIIAREAEIIDEIIQNELDAWNAPELERQLVEQFLEMSEEEQAVIPKEYRDKVKKIIAKLEQKYGMD